MTTLSNIFFLLGKRFKADELHPATMLFDKDGYWSDILKRQFTFTRGNVTCNTYVMVKLLDDPKHRYLTLDAVNMDNDNWVFGCKATKVYKNTRICESGDNLSGQADVMPSNGLRKTIQVRFVCRLGTLGLIFKHQNQVQSLLAIAFD